MNLLRCRLAAKFFDASHSVNAYLNKQQIGPKTVTDKVHFVQRLTGLKKKNIKSRGQMKGPELH